MLHHVLARWALLGGAMAAAPSRPAASGALPQVAADTVDLVIASTTDVHGRIRGWDYYADAPDPSRGLARAATIIDSLRGAAPGRVVVVDAGDFLQGNPLTFVAARIASGSGNAVIAAMNAVGYDAVAVGNHEYNYGVPYLRRAQALADFPFLSANTARADAGAEGRAGPFPAYRVVRRGGVAIGIVGATTPGVMVWDRDHVRGRLRLGAIVPAVRRAVGAARRAGAQVIVVVAHTGLDEASSYDTAATGLPSENVAARLAREVPGIDLVVYGHSHKEMADTVIGSTLLVQAKNWATSVSAAHLFVVRGPAGARVVARRATLVRAAGHAENPRVLTATREANAATVAWATSEIGTTPTAWRADSARVSDTALIDFVLDVMRRRAGADLAATAAFSLDASLPAGRITVAELARLYPYDNTLRAVRVTGAQLRAYLEFSARYFADPAGAGPALDPTVPGFNFDIVGGATYAYDLSRPIGNRLTKLAVRGRPVADTDTFTLALNNYRQTGGGGYAMLRGAPVVYDRQEDIRQLLIDEVRARKTLRPVDYLADNWSLAPASAVARAYVAMHGSAAAGERSGGPPSPSAVRLRIVATNDFHGALEARPDSRGIWRGGAGAVAAAIRGAEAECAPGCETLLVDGGDLFQGTPASNLAYGAPVVAIYNTLGYAASALGNHEFDWGTDTLRARMRQAHFPFLAANVRDTSGRDVDWIPDDTVVARGLLRVGIIGVATVLTPQTTKAVNTVGLRFDDPAPIVDSLTRALRAAGANVVVVVAHAGAFCDADGATRCGGEIIDLARALHERVDAIVSGHTHSLIDATISGVPVVQARSRGQAIAVVDLDVDPAAGTSRVVAENVRDVPAERSGALGDATVDSMAAAAIAAVQPLVERPIAVLATDLPKSRSDVALGNLVADAQRWAGKADLAVMNSGGIRAPLPKGPVNYGALFEVQPFANVLTRLTVHGRDLRAYLERLVRGDRPDAYLAGAVVTWDSTRAPGGRVVSLRLSDGRPVEDRGEYTVVLNDFMLTGGDGLGLSHAALRMEPLSIDDLQALIAYLKAAPQPVPPPTDARFVERGP